MTPLLRRVAVLCLLLLALPVLPVATAQQQPTDAEKLDTVKEFRRWFRQFKEESQQREAVMTLRSAECVEAAEELRKLLTHKSPVVQATAMEVIATFTQPATFQPWIDALPGTSDATEKALLIKILGRAKMATAVPALQVVAQDPKAPAPVKFEVLRALQAIGNADVAAAVAPHLSDADPLVRMAAADAVGGLKLTTLGPAVVPLLQDDAWQVQTAAVTALGIVRPQEAVQPMIDLMRKTGRIRTECAEALFRITGFDFGVDPDKWQQQWNRLMEIGGWRIPTEEELQKKAESRQKYDEFYGKKTERNTFAGITTTSTNVLFIIDVSGSMDDLVVERDKFQGYDDYKKFTVVRKELLAAVDSLTLDTNFDIVAFASDLQVWKKRMVQANVINRQSAKSWIERLRPLGGTEDQELAAVGLGGSANLSAGKTNTLKALMYAFGIDPENPPKAAITGGDKVSIKNKLDTVYFLSDGRPSIGKLVDTNLILQEVTKYNDVYKMVIHTIAIGEFQKEFLRDLASQNGGVFVDLGR